MRNLIYTIFIVLAIASGFAQPIYANNAQTVSKFEVDELLQTPLQQVGKVRGHRKGNCVRRTSKRRGTYVGPHRRKGSHVKPHWRKG